MAASSSPSSKPSSNPGDTYIGSVISLTSKYEIRYEGVLYHINSQDSTIGLKNVRSCGTEGRKSDGPQIPPSDKLYEFILFRGSDIKDLQVKSSPSACTDEQVSSDPAIIQSQHSDPLSTSPTPSLGGRTESAQGQTTPGWQSTPALTSRAYSSAQPPYPSINHTGSTNLSQATQTAAPSFPIPLYWQGYNGTSVNISHAPQQSFPFQSPSMVSSPLPVQNQIQVSGVWTSDMSHVPQQSFPFQSQSMPHSSSSISHGLDSYHMVSSPLPVQNQMQVSGVWTSDMSHVPQQSFPFQSQSMVSPLPVHNQMQVFEVWTSPITGLGNTSDSPIVGVTNASTPITPIPSIASNLLHPKFPPSLSPVQYSTSPDMPSTTSSTMMPPSSHVDTNPFPWLSQGTSTAGAQNAVKYVPNPEPVLSTQANPCPASSFAASNSSSFPSPLLPPLTPNQVAQSRSLAVPCAPNVYPDQNGTAIMTTIPPASPLLLPTPATQGMIAISPLISTSASQEPLLPLPGTAQQRNYLTTQFTEEFDFEAMNEKFKKDEMWGYLGMAKQRDKIDSAGDNATDQSIEVKENPGVVPKFDPKPAYKKDEFFDTISCNSLARGRNMQNHNHFPERMRRDTETFGNSHQRYNLGYGGYGGGRGDMYRGSHNRGRWGYGYRGRGRGYPPF